MPFSRSRSIESITRLVDVLVGAERRRTARAWRRPAWSCRGRRGRRSPRCGVIANGWHAPPYPRGRAPPAPHPRLDRLDRHAGARHRRPRGRRVRARRPVAPSAPGRRWSSRPARHGVARIALADADAAARAAEAWTDGEVLAGAEGLVRLVVESDADLVLNALVGCAGLGPTVADARARASTSRWPTRSRWSSAASSSSQLAEATGAQIIPVDSEHSALHQLHRRRSAPGAVDKLVLTASRRPVPRPHARRARGRHRRGGARATRRGRWAARSRSTRPR